MTQCCTTALWVVIGQAESKTTLLATASGQVITLWVVIGQAESRTTLLATASGQVITPVSK